MTTKSYEEYWEDFKQRELRFFVEFGYLYESDPISTQGITINEARAFLHGAILMSQSLSIRVMIPDSDPDVVFTIKNFSRWSIDELNEMVAVDELQAAEYVQTAVNFAVKNFKKRWPLEHDEMPESWRRK